MRAGLDLILDWAHAVGQGELALEHTHTLSSAINLLATPRKNLLQVNTEFYCKLRDVTWTFILICNLWITTAICNLEIYLNPQRLREKELS